MGLTVLLACEAPTRTIREPVGPAAEQLAALDAAVADVDRTRAALLASADAAVDAARGVDAADEAAATGQRELVATARRTARAASERLRDALAAVPEQAASYRRALTALPAAALPLEPAQQEPLRAVADAGEQEAAALEAFAARVRELWPAYAALAQVQATWLERSQRGWYRTDAEAAGAYVVLRRPVLPEVEQARGALQQADAARRPATDAMRRAVTAADAALAALR